MKQRNVFRHRRCHNTNRACTRNQPLYAPTQKEVDHARRVVEAAEAAAREGLGVVSLNGKMVDGPVIDRARLVLSRAELSGIREE